MNLQEMFDTAVAGLASQGFTRSSSDGFPVCLYRGPNGLKCAVGHLIPDDRYTPEMDTGDYSLEAVIEHASIVLTEDARAAVCSLQNAHDSGGNPGWMKRNLRAFASCFGLVIPEVLSK